MIRIERDFLGERPIPASAYYGIQTVRAVENFPITGRRLSPRFIHSLGIIKKAAALAHLALGMVPPHIGDAIVAACDRVLRGELDEHFVVDPLQGGAGTSINMNANEVIANAALEHLGQPKGSYKVLSPNSHVNMSQSTNDVMPTAVRITAALLSEELVSSLIYMKRSFRQKADEFDDVIKMGRTHLQDAVPIRLGQEFAAYASALARDVRRIEEARDRLPEVNMGATAVGTGLNAPPAYITLVMQHLRSLTGLHLRHPDNLVDATQNVDDLVFLSSALRSLALNLIKMMNDIRLMASGPRCGLNEINLPPLQPGSSIMPGKVNPVMPELVNQVCFRVVGNDHAVALAAQAGQFELNVMEPVIALCLFESLDIMTNAINAFLERCLQGITANADHCRRIVEQSVGITTALSPHLGYELTADVATEAYRTGKSVRQICLDRKLFTEGELAELLSPRAMTEPGVVSKQRRTGK